MGYRLAGYRSIGAVDIDPEMMNLYQKNLGPVPSYLGSVADLEKIVETFEGSLGDLDLLDGSPPCSTFSTAGLREKSWGVTKRFREGQAEQRLDLLFFDYLRLVGEIRPRMFVAENVSGMLVSNARGYVLEILRVAESLGYDVQILKLNASRYGVPQQRVRVFFIGRRRDLKLRPVSIPPEKSKVSVSEALKGLTHECGKTCRHALNPSTKEWEIWHGSAPGARGDDFNKRMYGTSQGFGSIKVGKDNPSRTIGSSGTITHFDEPRRLTSQEFFRLATFPDDYQIDRESQGHYITGMSVPPYLAREVALECLKSLRE